MSLPSSVKLVEVGARDGLQNETKIIPTNVKVEFINQLSSTGLKVIEPTSFVSPKWIPQLADHTEVYQQIIKYNETTYPVLVPNKHGLELALAAGVKEIAVFTTPSEEFSKRNTNASVTQSRERIIEIMALAKENRIRVRGYLSCVLGCPYQGEISPNAVADMSEELIDLGCYEVSLGDTIGVGTPTKTDILLNAVMDKVATDQIAVHFHDTYGQALVNIYVALTKGIHIIDSSVAGLGGCPYAKGATGNVATEDVLYMLNGMGIETGVDMMKLIDAGRYITGYLGYEPRSKVNVAISAKSLNE